MLTRTPLYPGSLLFLFLCALLPLVGVAGSAVADSAVPQAVADPLTAAVSPVAESPSAAAAAEAAASPAVVFPKITSRWNKWGLDLIEQHGRKNGWQPLEADSLRIVGQPQGLVGQGSLVNLKTGEVTVLSGSQDATNVRPYRLQAPELEDLKKILTSKAYADLATEGRPAGLDGASLLVESDWQGQYRWHLYWVDVPPPLAQIQGILQKAQTRERGNLPR